MPSGGESASSTISRLESKYCDILDRVHRRKEKDKEDKEKTLEPLDQRLGSRTFNALAKSATTASVRDESYSSLKERTPYRLATQRKRNKFLDSLEMDSYKRQTELGSSKSTATDSLLYDRNGREPTASSKYTLNKPRSKDSGYYDGKILSATSSSSAVGKENIFKSKYDPDELLSELNSSSILGSAASKAKRQTRPYKRSDTTTLNILHNSAATSSDLLDVSATTEADRRKENRRSGNFHHLQRSATQGFFNADDICTVPLSSDDDAPSDDPRQIERDFKRKEIESILQKYAPLDDKKAKEKKSKESSSSAVAAAATTTVNPIASERSPDAGILSRIKSPTQQQQQHHHHHHHHHHHFHHGGGRHQHGVGAAAATSGLQKSYTVTNVSSHLTNGGGLYNGSGSILTIHTGAGSSSAAALYKHQQQQQQLHQQLLMRSSRSRIPKALSTFVRIRPLHYPPPRSLVLFLSVFVCLSLFARKLH